MKKTKFKSFNFMNLIVLVLFLFSASAALSGCGRGSSGSGGSGSGGGGGGTSGSSVSGSVEGGLSPLAGMTVSLYGTGNATALASGTTKPDGSFNLSYNNPGGNALLYMVATNGPTVFTDILGNASGMMSSPPPIIVDEATTVATVETANNYNFTMKADGTIAPPPSTAPDYANVATMFDGMVNSSHGQINPNYADANNLNMMSGALAECVTDPGNSACTNIDNGNPMSNTNTTVSVMQYMWNNLSSTPVCGYINTAAQTASSSNNNPYSTGSQTLTIPSTGSFTFVAGSESPIGGYTGISTGANISLKFSNPVNFSTVSTGSTGDFNVTTNGGSPVSGTFSPGSSDYFITFTPSGGLSAGTTYTAAVNTGIKDIYGNSLSAGDSWSFTTGTTLPAPTVTSISPSSLATGVSTSPIITVTFSEAMNPNSFDNTTTMVTASGGAAVNMVNPVWNAAGTTVSVNPASPLTANTKYTLTFTSGGITAQNGMAIASAYTSSFTTAANAGALVDMTPSGIPAANQLALVEMDKNGNIISGEAINPSGSVDVLQLSGVSNTIKNTYTVGTVEPTINNMVVDSAGNFWLPMPDSAGTPYLYELPVPSPNNAAFTQYSIPSGDSYFYPSSQSVTGFTNGFGMDSNGNIWLPVYNSTNNGQLLEITGVSGTAATVAHTYPLPQGILSVNAVVIDSSNNVWMTSSPSTCGNSNSDELLELPKGGTSVSVAATLPTGGTCNGNPNSTAIDPSGNIWIPAQNGSEDVLYYYPTSSAGPLSAAIDLAPFAGYPDTMIVASDAAGNIWVALTNDTLGTGELIEVNDFGVGNGFAVVGSPLPLSFAPGSMFIDPNGNIWMATNNASTAANKLEEIPAIAAAGYFAVSGPVNPY